MRLATVNLTPEDLFRQIARILNGNVELLDNCSVKVITIADSGAANADIVITHGLGRVPQFYHYNVDRNCVVYDQARATWTATTMTLRCSSANAVIKLMVF